MAKFSVTVTRTDEYEIEELKKKVLKMSDGKNGFEKTKHNFPYKWTLKDAVFTKDKGKVFSCFAYLLVYYLYICGV